MKNVTVLIDGVEVPYDVNIAAHSKAYSKRNVPPERLTVLSMAEEAVQHVAAVAGSLVDVLNTNKNAPGLAASAVRLQHAAADVLISVAARGAAPVASPSLVAGAAAVEHAASAVAAALAAVLLATVWRSRRR